jgi:hypothetical protein
MRIQIRIRNGIAYWIFPNVDIMGTWLASVPGFDEVCITQKDWDYGGFMA